MLDEVDGDEFGSHVELIPEENLFDDSYYEPTRKKLPEQYVNDEGKLVDSIISLPLELVKILFRDEFKCPICLDTLEKTSTVAACLHRFCSKCLHKNLRESHHGCPNCRVKIASKRSSKPDETFDALINIFTGNGLLLNHSEGELSNSTAVSEILKSDRELDIDLCRRMHHEKVQQFKGRADIVNDKKRKEPPSGVSSGYSALESTVNFAIFPCPQWIEADSNDAITQYFGNPSLRYQEMTLKKPYLRVPPLMCVADLKEYLRRKYRFSAEDFCRLQITISQERVQERKRILSILSDNERIQDVAAHYWDGEGEFTLHFRLYSTRVSSGPNGSCDANGDESRINSGADGGAE